MPFGYSSIGPLREVLVQAARSASRSRPKGLDKHFAKRHPTVTVRYACGRLHLSPKRLEQSVTQAPGPYPASA